MPAVAVVRGPGLDRFVFGTIKQFGRRLAGGHRADWLCGLSGRFRRDKRSSEMAHNLTSVNMKCPRAYSTSLTRKSGLIR